MSGEANKAPPESAVPEVCACCWGPVVSGCPRAERCGTLAGSMHPEINGRRSPVPLWKLGPEYKCWPEDQQLLRSVSALLKSVHSYETPIEVTPEMIEAGRDSLIDNWDDFYWEENAARECYLAMEKARLRKLRNPPSTSRGLPLLHHPPKPNK